MLTVAQPGSWNADRLARPARTDCEARAAAADRRADAGSRQVDAQAGRDFEAAIEAEWHAIPRRATSKRGAQPSDPWVVPLRASPTLEALAQLGGFAGCEAAK